METLKILAEIAVILFAFSGLLADIIIIIVLLMVRRGAKLLFGYFDETPFDQEEKS